MSVSVNEAALDQQQLQKLQNELAMLVGTDQFLAANRETRHSILSNFVKRNHGVDLAYMVDDQGVQCLPNATATSTAIAYTGDGTGVDRSDRAWYAIPARTGRPYLSRKYLSVATGQLCMTVSVPVQDKGGSLLGIVAADLPVPTEH